MANTRERFWVALGDIHEQLHFFDAIAGVEEAEAVLLSGDLTNIGSRALAESLLAHIETRAMRIFAQIGNMDTPAVEEVLTERGYNVHARTVDLGQGVCLAAVGCSTPTPFGTPSEYSEETIRAWAHDVLTRSRDWERVIFMVHTPPLGTAVDRLASGVSVGSPGIRDLILEFQPDIVVTGHIHEARGQDCLGRSVVLNPGSFADGGFVRVTDRAAGLVATLERAR